MTDDGRRILHLATRMADLLKGDDLSSTLHALTHAAVETLPGVDQASMTIRHSDGSLQSYALTAGFLKELDDWQYAEGEGPCYDGVTSSAFSVCGDLANDPRFPNYGPRAVAAGIRSQAGIRLFDLRQGAGALNLYAKSTGGLADINFLATLFTQHARTAITHAREIESLRDAVMSRQVIGQAVGVLMERFAISDDKAFAFLARISQERNVKVRLIAEEILQDE